MSRICKLFGRKAFGAGCLAATVFAVLFLATVGDAAAQRGLDPALIQQLQGGNVPGGVEGTNPVSDEWRSIRQGINGSVSIPDKKAGTLVQSEGEAWRSFHNGPLKTYSLYVLGGMLALLAVFFLLRGRIRIEHGKSGKTITRFNGFERFGHWLLATSFIVLALTGLNLVYGRYVLLPLIGADAFAELTWIGKHLHNYLSAGFIIGLGIIFVLWVARNIPHYRDLIWMSKAGGLFVKGVHPPSGKFNAGQKVIFWLVILGGVSISLSGWALLFPFEYAMFGKTFEFVNLFGFDLPTQLTPLQEMQLAQLWHSIVAVVLTAVILAHIYIGSIGMEGAFDAMGSGEVDLNWAKEHHNLWVEEVLGEEAFKHAEPPAKAAPAE
ncbi:MAG: formate dehydrogenase subunit gamma [Rhodobiaceae bacterium]|nr:formate dehydrogenase subunit gamma [Rhodobiaceae bacterium]MCC0041047.1 formate dehydrogenase subunit gamma [Rhodobiaceae bacterium]MCC0053938.1 formate dehydrogenase subunit gamma [Rhodobiaceae bacterium]